MFQKGTFLFLFYPATGRFSVKYCGFSRISAFFYPLVPAPTLGTEIA